MEADVVETSLLHPIHLPYPCRLVKARQKEMAISASDWKLQILYIINEISFKICDKLKFSHKELPM